MDHDRIVPWKEQDEKRKNTHHDAIITSEEPSREPESRMENNQKRGSDIKKGEDVPGWCDYHKGVGARQPFGPSARGKQMAKCGRRTHPFICKEGDTYERMTEDEKAIEAEGPRGGKESVKLIKMCALMQAKEGSNGTKEEITKGRSRTQGEVNETDTQMPQEERNEGKQGEQEKAGRTNEEPKEWTQEQGETHEAERAKTKTGESEKAQERVPPEEEATNNREEHGAKEVDGGTDVEPTQGEAELEEPSMTKTVLNIMESTPGMVRDWVRTNAQDINGMFGRYIIREMEPHTGKEKYWDHIVDMNRAFQEELKKQERAEEKRKGLEGKLNEAEEARKQAEAQKAGAETKAKKIEGINTRKLIAQMTKQICDLLGNDKKLKWVFDNHSKSIIWDGPIWGNDNTALCHIGHTLRFHSDAIKKNEGNLYEIRVEKGNFQSKAEISTERGGDLMVYIGNMTRHEGPYMKGGEDSPEEAILEMHPEISSIALTIAQVLTKKMNDEQWGKYNIGIADIAAALKNYGVQPWDNECDLKLEMSKKNQEEYTWQLQNQSMEGEIYNILRYISEEQEFMESVLKEVNASVKVVVDWSGDKTEYRARTATNHIGHILTREIGGTRTGNKVNTTIQVDGEEIEKKYNMENLIDLAAFITDFATRSEILDEKGRKKAKNKILELHPQIPQLMLSIIHITRPKILGMRRLKTEKMKKALETMNQLHLHLTERKVTQWTWSSENILRSSKDPVENKANETTETGKKKRNEKGKGGGANKKRK